MNTFVAILFVILGLLFVVFFGYELYSLIRDIRKNIKKKKESKTIESDNKNTNKEE